MLGISKSDAESHRGVTEIHGGILKEEFQLNILLQLLRVDSAQSELNLKCVYDSGKPYLFLISLDFEHIAACKLIYPCHLNPAT